MKENKMDGTCGRNGNGEIFIQVFGEENRRKQADLVVDSRIILT
jgi:hypothetical protein